MLAIPIFKNMLKSCTLGTSEYLHYDKNVLKCSVELEA